METETIGIYSGSFNPPHWAHIIAAQAFRKEADLSRLYIVPVTPYKLGSSDISAEASLALCRKAFSGIWNMQIWEKERRKERFSYTITVLRDIANLHKQARLAYLVGADVLLYMPDWYAIKEILELADIYYVQRDDIRTSCLKQAVEQLNKLGGRLYPIKMRIPPISSTRVRQNLRQGKPISLLVPWPVAQYIKEHDLYRK